MANNTPNIRSQRACTPIAWTALGVLIAVASTLGACATRPLVNVKEAREVNLSKALSDRDLRLQSLQTAAVMEYTSGSQHVKAREQLVLVRPASIRVEAMSPLGVALVVAADAGQIAVFDPSKNTLMRGAATAATLDRFARIPMAPEEAVRLLLGLSPDSGMLSFPPTSMDTDRQSNITTLLYARPHGVTDQLAFLGHQLVMVREQTAGGTVAYEVRYSDYQDIGGIDFPYTVAAHFPPSDTRITFHYERPIVDGEVPDSAFELTPGPGTKQINLSMRPAAAGAPRG